jgi:hypothetical protein
MKKHTTRQTKNPGNKRLISTDKGRFYLHLPYSIGSTFAIGAVNFTNNGSYYSADKPIPQSWLIDLSA